MERVRKFSIKYVVVALLLALALPFSSFASENVSLDDSQFSLIWNANNYNYIRQTTSSSTTSWPGEFQKFYMFDKIYGPSDFNGLTLYGRIFRFSAINTSRITVNIPLNIQGIDFFSTDLFFGLYKGSSPEFVMHNDFISFSSASYVDFQLERHSLNHLNTGFSYYFYPEPSVPSTFPSGLFRTFNRLSLDNRSSSSDSILFLSVTFDVSISLNSYPWYFYIGMASDTEIGAQDGQQQIVINGLNGIQGSIDSLVSEMQQSNGQIVDQLGNVLYELEGDAVTAADAEQLVQDSLSKGEELGQLGDALASVPKPDVNSITSVMNPSTILQNNDSASVQLALASIYSWDKLLSILGVLVAVFSISYILFGKKK